MAMTPAQFGMKIAQQTKKAAVLPGIWDATPKTLTAARKLLADYSDLLAPLVSTRGHNGLKAVGPAFKAENYHGNWGRGLTRDHLSKLTDQAGKQLYAADEKLWNAENVMNNIGPGKQAGLGGLGCGANKLVGEKTAIMTGSTLGALGGLVSAAKKENNSNLTAVQAAQAAGRGGLIGAAAEAVGRKGLQLGARIAANGRLVAPTSQIRAGRIIGALAGGLSGGLASRGAIDTLSGENNDVLRGIGNGLGVAGKGLGAGLGGLAGGAAGLYGGTGAGLGVGALVSLLKYRRLDPWTIGAVGQNIGVPAGLAAALPGTYYGGRAGYNVANKLVGEKKSFMVGGTIGALGGLATSKKNKRGLGAGRGALIGGGTELGVYPGAALGGLGGLALGGLISALARRNGAHPGDMLAGGALGAGAGALGGGYLGNIASRALLDDSSHSKQDEKKEKDDDK